MKCLLFFSVLLATATHAQTITPDQAKNYAGKQSTVCGQVYGSYHSTKIKGEPTFIDMGAKYPNSTFTILIWGSDLAKFSYDPKDLIDKNVCVTGMITMYNNKPEIDVKSPSQISEKN